ncbi:MAG TPA: hypothetical protein VGP72_19760 [Planctomycetota bacterium]|jgi:hypothetical protein
MRSNSLRTYDAFHRISWSYKYSGERAPAAGRKLVAISVCALLVVLAGGITERLIAGSGSDAAAWREMSIAPAAPDVLTPELTHLLGIRNRQDLPVLQVDGREFGGKLPQTILLKLDQPGAAYVVVETAEGTILKGLEDATPGFVSPCRLGTDSFGTTDGEPVSFDRGRLAVKRLWVIQDNAAEHGRIPGWLYIPQTRSSEPNMPVMVAAR